MKAAYAGEALHRYGASVAAKAMAAVTYLRREKY